MYVLFIYKANEDVGMWLLNGVYADVVMMLSVATLIFVVCVSSDSGVVPSW